MNSQQLAPPFQNNATIEFKEKGQTVCKYLTVDYNTVLEMDTRSLSTKFKSTNGWQTGTDQNGECNKRTITLLRFAIEKVSKKYTITFGDCIKEFILECRRPLSPGNISKPFIIKIPEQSIVTGTNLMSQIKKDVGDNFSPFHPCITPQIINQYLPFYVMELYKRNSDEHKEVITNDFDPDNKYRFNDLIKSCYFDEKNTTKYVSDFFKLMTVDAKTFLKLVLFYFSSQLKDFTKSFSSNIKPECENILLAQNFSSYYDKKLLTSFVNPGLDAMNIKKLSELKQTKKHDSISEMVYAANNSTLIVEDNYYSNSLARNQNNQKIYEIMEMVINNKPIRDNKLNNKFSNCNAVVISNRYLTEFSCVSENCFLIVNADELEKYKPFYRGKRFNDNIINFSKVLSNYIQHNKYDKESQCIINEHTLPKFNCPENLYTFYTFSILAWIINKIFIEYLNKDISNELNNYIIELANEQCKIETIHQPDSILKSFKEIINRIPFDKETVHYEKIKTSEKNDLIYHESEGLLLFDQKKFYNLFLDEFLMSQTDYRKLLADNNYLVSNTKERNFYRLPIGNRKEYIAVPISLLNDEAIKLLPKKSIPPYEWIAEQQNYNIYLGNDANGFPIYWPVDKGLTNKFAVVLGNTGFGKTYWTTSILIKGLHDSGHNVIILDSNFIHNYSVSELRKALPEDYIQDNFCFLSECELSDDSADEMLDCYIQNRDRIFVIDTLDDKQRNEFITQLIKYQQACKEAEKDFEDVFMILDEANNEETFKSKALKYVYDQGRKLKISIVTILQYFSGIKSENFRKQIFQANLKVVFQMNDATVGKLLNEYPGCPKDELKKRIFDLERGEAVVFGEFEQLDGKIKKSIFYKKAD